jgi:hypothetical protein
LRRVIALAAKCDFPVYVDEVVERFEVISISAGLRGLQILIAPPDDLRATNGTLAALSHPKKTEYLATITDSTNHGRSRFSLHPSRLFSALFAAQAF